MLKNFIKKFIPEQALGFYHLLLAHLASFVYGHPSKKLIVIGVTGTNGKSTTVNLIAKILEEAGPPAGGKVAITSTVNFKIGDKEKLNDLKMTMPGRFFLQRLLRQAVDNGCAYAIIESSSEGVLQYRYVGINYDAMVFTNLTPEHIEAHGGFENYKKAKLKYFKHLQNLPRKILNGKVIPKIIASNIDDHYAQEFLNFNVDKKITFGKNSNAGIVGTNLQTLEHGISFRVNNTTLNLQLKGMFDFYNALAAIALTSGFGIPLQTSKQALEKIPVVPGRVELINEGQNFKVVVDYAPEPESLRQLYATVKTWKYNRIIHLLGSTGGGRDKSRRAVLGKMAGENADIVIVTNEDPYDDDPKEIIHNVADGAIAAGKIIGQNLFREIDRRIAIAKALSMAQEFDLVLITGKGSEQKMAVKGGYIPWDDRKVASEELKKLLNKND